MRWQPIETAPKDGTRILVCDQVDWVEIILWSSEIGNWLDANFDLPDYDPVWWMLLPEPPQVDELGPR